MCFQRKEWKFVAQDFTLHLHATLFLPSFLVSLVLPSLCMKDFPKLYLQTRLLLNSTPMNPLWQTPPISQLGFSAELRTPIQSWQSSSQCQRSSAQDANNCVIELQTAIPAFAVITPCLQPKSPTFLRPCHLLLYPHSLPAPIHSHTFLSGNALSSEFTSHSSFQRLAQIPFHPRNLLVSIALFSPFSVVQQ